MAGPQPMACYRVVHVTKHAGPCVYVGRANARKQLQGHPLCNTEPLPPRASDAERAANIARYRERLLARPDLAEQLEALRTATRNGELPLACWCAPKRCHADVLAELLASAEKEQGQ